MTGRETEIVRHLSEDDLNRLLTTTDDEKVSKQLIFIKRLYKGATLEDAADDVGISQSTGSRWAKIWNKGGLGLLTPSFGGGRPPKLNEQQRERLLTLLEEDEPWKKQEIQHLINTEFDVEFHPNYLPRLLDDLGLSYAIPRTERPNRRTMLPKSSTNAFLTRSPKMNQTTHITNAKETTAMRNGRLMMISERTVGRRSDSLISRTHNRGTIPSGSTQ